MNKWRDLRVRVYVDTSVFGGVFDQEFERPSRLFFEEVRNKKFSLVTSAVVRDEIKPAPNQVKDFFEGMLTLSEVTEVDESVLDLRQAYLKEGIVMPKSSDDALHVALATHAECKMIVSWNFKHIVHFEKIPKYNAVNLLKGYEPIDIFSPLEVIHYEDR